MSSQNSELFVLGKKKAVVIGISYHLRKFSRLSRILDAHDDARAMRNLLIQSYGYAKEDITLMLDDHSTYNAHPKLIPTQRHIIKQIKLLVHGATANDHFFFYFAGHTHQQICTRGSESDGMDEVIDACDGKDIIDDDLKKYLVEPLPKGCRLFALFDSCHSETILDLPHHSCNGPSSLAAVQREQRRTILSEVKSLTKAMYDVKFSNFRVGRTQKRRQSSFLNFSAETAMPTSPVLRQPPRSLTHDESIIATSPVSWFTPMSALRRVLSPTSMSRRSCTGACEIQKPGDWDKAYVVSLSACKDSQLAWDENGAGKTMTKVTCISSMLLYAESTSFSLRFSKTTRTPPLIDLLTRIRERVNNQSRRRLENTPITKVIMRRHTDVFNAADIDRIVRARIHAEETRAKLLDTNSQEPRYASHYRLDLTERFYP